MINVTLINNVMYVVQAGIYSGLKLVALINVLNVKQQNWQTVFVEITRNLLDVLVVMEKMQLPLVNLLVVNHVKTKTVRTVETSLVNVNSVIH